MTSPASQLGFVVATSNLPIKITKSGAALLEAAQREDGQRVSKVLLTALSRVQVPWRTSSRGINEYHGSPLGSILHLYEKIDAAPNLRSSLSKNEAKLLLPILLNRDCAERVFRLLEKLEISKKRSIEDLQNGVALLSQTKISTLYDYGDTISRYLVFSGLFEWDCEIEFGHPRLRISPIRKEQAFRMGEFLDHGDKCSDSQASYMLSLRAHIESWPAWLGNQDEYGRDCKNLSSSICEISGETPHFDVRDPEAFFTLLDIFRKNKHTSFAQSDAPLRPLSKTRKDLVSLSSINKRRQVRHLPAPLALEVVVGEAMASFGGIVHHNPRYLVDTQNRPIGTASGGAGGADCIVESNNNIVVVEATMIRGSRQQSQEFDPVMRHVNWIDEHFGKPNACICLLIVPSVHMDLVNRSLSHARDIAYETTYNTARIIPVDFSEFENLLKSVDDAWRADGTRVSLDDLFRWSSETFHGMGTRKIDRDKNMWNGFMNERLSSWNKHVRSLSHAPPESSDRVSPSKGRLIRQRLS